LGTIKIVIADTAFIVRRGIKNLIEENRDFQFIGEVTDAKSLEILFKNTLPDVLIVDHCCDDCFSVDFIDSVKKNYPSVQILVISHEKSIEQINNLLRIGIKNYVLKNCSEGELNKAIYNCSLNKKFFSEDIIDALLENEIALKQTKNIGDLTERESEIIRLLVNGNRPKEVAEMLHISLYTVNTHKKNIYRKLGVNHSYELAKYAVEAGFMVQD
jgi:DNA-binding NarL/FixJ family response regulator